VDRIIDHLGLTFVANKPPPSHVFAEVVSPLSPAALDPFADAKPRLSIHMNRFRFMSAGIHAGESRG
jgi:hypothetical protein